MKQIIVLFFIFLFFFPLSGYAKWRIGASCGIQPISDLPSIDEGISGNVNFCICIDNKCNWVVMDGEEIFRLLEYLKNNNGLDDPYIKKVLYSIEKQIKHYRNRKIDKQWHMGKP